MQSARDYYSLLIEQCLRLVSKEDDILVAILSVSCQGRQQDFVECLWHVSDSAG